MFTLTPQTLVGCGGFLLAVLSFDLMFNTHLVGHGAGPLPEAPLAAVAAYYYRVTTTANPMGCLVGTVVLCTVAGPMWQLRDNSTPRRLRYVAFATGTVPITIALLSVVPAAVRLEARGDAIAVQSGLARYISTPISRAY